MTRALCDVLAERSDVIVEYIASDTSSALANSALNNVSYGRAFAKTFNPPRPPQEQGIDTCSFDIIIGLHSLHAFPNIAKVLSSLRTMPVPGGTLCMVELDGTCWDKVPGGLWHDTVFGSLSEWFGFTDGRSHPIMSPEGWGKAVGNAGFDDYQSSVEAEDGFEFLFTAKVPQTHPVTQYTSSEPVFLSYTFGQEMALQQEILALDATTPMQLWILAEDGIDEDFVTGLTTTLVKEYANWEVHAAIFPPHFDHDRRKETVLARRDCLKKEAIIRFDSKGMPHVPKVFYAAPPKIEEGSPEQPLQQDHVSISIESRSSSYLSYYGFVGSVLESKSENFQPGDIVTGVTKEDSANPITCFSGCIATVSEGMNTDAVANNSLALVIASLILGPERGLDASADIPPLKVVLANEDDLAEDLSSILSLVPNLATVSRHDAPLDSQFDVVVSSLEESETHPEYTCWGNNHFLWDKTLSVIVMTFWYVFTERT